MLTPNIFYNKVYFGTYTLYGGFIIKAITNMLSIKGYVFSLSLKLYHLGTVKYFQFKSGRF